MSDAVIFAVIFVGFFILRFIAATVVFFFILPEGDRCPNCDAVTLRVKSRGWNVADAVVSHELVLRVWLARPAASRSAHPNAAVGEPTKHGSKKA